MFKDLFVLDIANNHFGDVNHLDKIINQFSKRIIKDKINACFKFQFRNLDTYIHKDAWEDKESHYVKRFTSTKLQFKYYRQAVEKIKKLKIKTCCTPFDEYSVKLIEDFKFDFLKIASVSSLDWSLLERATKNKIPKIISTGGKTLEEIDKIVSYMKHKKQKFALMHCVSIYPTENQDLNLYSISEMKNRYPDVEIGWSTHENPNDMLPMSVSYGLGARIFERHIGLNSKKYPLNKYSMNIDQFDKYVDNFISVKNSIGYGKKDMLSNEIDSLKKLDRGVYVSKNLSKNEQINEKDIYFAFPCLKNQLAVKDFSLKTYDYILNKNKIKDNAILIKDINKNLKNDITFVHHTLHKVRAAFNITKIKIGKEYSVEISHHYGVSKFNKFGCVLFTCVDEGDYAKKLVYQNKNQFNPFHLHKKKDESFQILYGKLKIFIGNKTYILNEGDIFKVKKNTWHAFKTLSNGCVFEEVSNVNIRKDSYYKDAKITNNLKRKTFVTPWHKFVF